jgi:hypothetical protein
MPGESLLWTGQPCQTVIFHPSDWYAIPFSFMWGGFAIFWEYMVTGGFGLHGAPSFFAVWGIPFILIGQYMIWGRFLYTAWRKSVTFYGLTNQRVLVLNTRPTRGLAVAFLNGFQNAKSLCGRTA